MAIKITITSIKPQDVAWFHESSPDNAAINQQMQTWTKSQPGLISHDTEYPDSNTRKVTIVFDTIEHYANWLENKPQLPEQAIRVKYHVENNIHSSTTETVI
jgi:antibiotic biosynthesis monooxygenase (ABM) superfamily enzyme